MTQVQKEKEVLLCTHKDCKRPQGEDGEFCDLHYPTLMEEVQIVVIKLENLRQSFCDIENKSMPYGRSILAIDRIDTLLGELKSNW